MSDAPGANRRSFLLTATGVAVAAGGVLAAWPLVRSMAPAADAQRRTVRVRLRDLTGGRAVLVRWGGRVILIGRRSAGEAQTHASHGGLFVLDAACAWDRCVVMRDDPIRCPCCGSSYDHDGRVLVGPARRPLGIPPHHLDGGEAVVIGEET